MGARGAGEEGGMREEEEGERGARGVRGMFTVGLRSRDEETSEDAEATGEGGRVGVRKV